MSQSTRDTELEAMDDKLALRDSQAFHDVIDVQTMQVTKGLQEER